MQQTASETLSAPRVVTEVPGRALVSWVLFEMGGAAVLHSRADILVGPYFATAVVGDPKQGQALWGYAAAAAGVLVAIGSPLLGAVADAGGRRKPWIAGFVALMLAGLCLLWVAKPEADVTTLWIVVAAYAMAFAGAEFAAVFVNSIMPTLVPADKLGSLSGIGWGTGYAGGLAEPRPRRWVRRHRT